MGGSRGAGWSVVGGVVTRCRAEGEEISNGCYGVTRDSVERSVGIKRGARNPDN